MTAADTECQRLVWLCLKAREIALEWDDDALRLLLEFAIHRADQRIVPSPDRWR